MPRIMSCAETVPAVLDETKTVTRRLGWWTDRNGRRLLKPGDELSIVKKAMGRKPGEPLVRLALVEVIDVRRERLMAVTDEEVIREGVADDVSSWAADHSDGTAFESDPDRIGELAWWFALWYATQFGCPIGTTVTRIEWRYLHPVGPIGPPRPPLVPLVEWDDGKERPLRLVPDHLRSPYEGATS